LDLFQSAARDLDFRLIFEPKGDCEFEQIRFLFLFSGSYDSVIADPEGFVVHVFASRFGRLQFIFFR
jgi:hypothetical protein